MVDKTGVSATHLDWSMVPYVRKSFRKHWKDGLRYVASWEPSEVEINLSGLMTEEQWCEYEYKHGHQIEMAKTAECPIDFYPQYDEYEKIYRYALNKTVEETYQAVEGMYHNLKY